MKRIFFFSLSLLAVLNLFAKEVYIDPGPNAQERLQEALILIEEGDTLIIKSGYYKFEDGLSLDVDNVTVKGEGIDSTILDFKNQQSGAQGLLVTSDRVTLSDFSILDAKGDALKVIGAKGINMINLKTEWTGGPKSTNGAYGFYPVESEDVLIDGCVAIGASDAGIYVGQSKNIIVRNSIAQYNVAGIEIENSYYADVYNNLASHNTGGILVFDLPDLPQQGGHHIRVFDNESIDNDTDNFAPEGNIVGEVPRGTGIIIMANSNVEVFNNSTLNEKFSIYEHKSSFDGELISNLFSNLNSLNIYELHNLSNIYLKIGYSNTDIKIHLNKIYSMPIFYVLMTILGFIIINKLKNFITFSYILSEKNISNRLILSKLICIFILNKYL